jgi:hypothetical protein
MSLRLSIRDLYNRGKMIVQFQRKFVCCRDCPHFKNVLDLVSGITKNICVINQNWYNPDSPRICIDFPFEIPIELKKEIEKCFT